MATHHPRRLRQRLIAAATAGATLAVTLALLVGMPYVLWLATGLPWPSHITLGELGHRLMQPIGDPLVIDLLAAVGWLCWAAFACTVVRETAWYLSHLPQLVRDRHAHHEHLAALTVKGSLAALCIGTFVVALVSLYRPQSVGAQGLPAPDARPHHTTVTAPLVPASTRHSPPALATAMPPTQVAPVEANRQGAKAATPPGADRFREYTVVEGDTLWDIARTHLGDGLRWPRIYALNKERVQSDGHRLADPNVITPGWRLTIPAPGVSAAPPTPALAAPDDNHSGEAATPKDRPAPGRSGEASRAPTSAPSPDEGGRQDGPAGRPSRNRGDAAISLGTASLIGITTAAGLLAARRYWYWHRRSLRDPGEGTETPTLSPLVEKASRAAYAAVRSRPAIGGDELAPRCVPPRPPLPAGTVTIGTRAGVEVPLDELLVPGGCTWVGPGAGAAARALLVGILTAAERQRPGPAKVTAVVARDVAERLLPGLPDRFSALTQSINTADAIRAAERHLIALARTHEHEHEHEPLIQASDTPSPGMLLLLVTPEAAHIGQLCALANQHRMDALIVLTLDGSLPDARTWHIAADGAATGLGTPDRNRDPLTLFHLTPDAGRDMVDVLLTAHGQRPAPRAPLAPTPRADDQRPEAPTGSSEDGASARPHVGEPSPPAQKKPVRLHVLGPVSLYVRGHQDPVGTHLRGEVHEFLALLATHPSGLLASDIAHRLQLAPGSEQIALKNLRRAVRRTLRAATGITAQEFVLLQGELHKLHPALVETDLADFDHNLKAVFAAPHGKGAFSEALHAARTALSHYRGTFAQGGDYLWADAVRESIAVRATDAALKLASQAERPESTPGEREAVLALLEHLAAIHPDHERLAQHSIRLYQACGRHDAARQTYVRLKRHLAELGVAPEPATEVLITSRAHRLGKAGPSPLQ
ncbi:BTAD domain-containing putative transcriptional regulator [Streptomyces buecherae]|uniref:BTAD domain-containing putative transcriptional regulator n=1 Tax=Streptomyces buecherae TaxID=2763006 RepID=UPI0033E9AC59